jgi:acyl-ACP thioesterase
MAGIYKYRIEPRDVDASLRVRIYTMGDYILQAAGDDADTLGFGIRDLNSGNSSWVLSRMAVEMKRLPARHEEIAVYTWVSDYGRLVTTRNMVIHDEAGTQIGAVVTQWAMIDLATRRPLDLSELSNKGTSLVDREPPIEKPSKIAPFEATLHRPHEVVYSDIDFNGHVNSMKYLEWMADTMPADLLEEAREMRFDINYIHEATLGQRLSIGYTATERHLFDIQTVEGLSICKAAIRLAE